MFIRFNAFQYSKSKIRVQNQNWIEYIEWETCDWVVDHLVSYCYCSPFTCCLHTYHLQVPTNPISHFSLSSSSSPPCLLTLVSEFHFLIVPSFVFSSILSLNSLIHAYCFVRLFCLLSWIYLISFRLYSEIVS
jgi:hypothetical protein